MPSIAQAVVTIRPDLTGFAGQLRTDLDKQIKLVGEKARTITLNAQLAPGTATALQGQLKKITGLTVNVTPTISAKDKAAFQRSIGTVPVKVSLIQPKGSAAQIQSVQKSAAQAAAVAPISPGKIVPDQSVAILEARKQLEVQTKDLTVAETDLARAKSLSEKADTRALQLAQGKAGAQAKLAATVAGEGKAVVVAAEARVAAITAEIEAQGQQAAAAEIAERQMLILAEANTATTVTSEKQALAAIAVANALDKQAAAALRLAEAQTRGASTQELAPLERAVRGAGLDVKAKEARAREVATAEAAAANAPILEAQRAAAEVSSRFAKDALAADTASIAAKDALRQKITTVAEANKGVTLALAAQTAEQKALDAAVETQNANAVGLRSATKAAADEAVVSAQQRLVVTKAQIEAEELLAAASVKAGEAQTIAARQGLTGAPAAKKEAKLFGEASSLAGDAVVSAQLAGNSALEQEARLLQTTNTLREDERRKIIASTVASAERLKVETVIAGVQKKLDKADDTTQSLAARRTAAAAADKAAAQALITLTGATFKATEADIAAVKVLETKSALRLRSIELDIAAAAAADKAAAAAAREAQIFSQAQRGALGTSAGFLGLRGAILSASGGFLAATIAVTALAKTIGTASELQRSLNIFQAVAGATADQMARVSAEAKTLGADLSLPATSANDAAAAMTELARAGLTTENSIAAARGVLQLAAAANIQVGESATIVATQLNAFGLAGEEATRVADLLTGASKEAQGEIGDFALAFQQVAAVANQVNLPIETTTAILTQFAKAGLRGSDAGTSLRTMLLRLVPTTQAAKDAQAELGIVINDSIPIGQQFFDLVNQYTIALSKLGPIAQQESLTKIFGQDAIRGASISLTEGATALTGIQVEVSKAGLAADQSAARMKGLSGAIEGLKSAIETFAGTIGSTTLPALESITRELADIVTTADAAVQAIQRLGDTGIGPVTPNAATSALSDPLATVGVAAAAAFGVKKLLALKAERAARKLANAEAIAGAETVAAAEVAAAGVTQGAWTKTSGGVIVATNVQTGVQVAAARTVTAANVKAALASGLAWVKASSLIKGLAIGAGLSIAADQIGGDPGSDRAQISGTLSGAAQGAVIGSIVPGVGTAVGAAGGALFGAVTSAVAGRKARKAQWDALSAEDQWAWFLEQEGQQADGSFATPGRGIQQLGLVGFTLKPNPFTAQAQQTISIPTLGSLGAVTQGSVQPQTGSATGVTTFTAKLDFIKNFVAGNKEQIKALKENATLSAELALAEAQFTGDTKAADAATQDLIDINQKQIDSILKVFTTFTGKGGPVILTAERANKLRKKLIELYKEGASLQSQMTTAAAFQISTGTQIANINAGATAGLSDNLGAQQAALNEINAALEKAIKNKEDQATIDALRVQQAQQRATISGTNDSIQAQAEAEAKQQVANAQARLRIAADAAGNIGAAENKYIAFLRAQTKSASLTTAEQIAAQEALTAELQKRESALKAVVQASQNLTAARLANRLSLAQGTPGIKDDKAALNAQIRNNQALIASLRAQESGLKKTSLAYLELEERVQGLIGANIGLRKTIKDLDGANSGFSLEDLFKESLSQFNQFASNVSTSVTTPGGVRGAIGGAIAAQNPNLTQADSRKISEARRTNDLLNDILNTLKSGETQPPATVTTRSAGVTSSAEARLFAKVRSR